MSHFLNLQISNWQQFHSLDIDLSERVTLLTGANGSGKTTILNLLARHCGWTPQSLATPYKLSASGGFHFLARAPAIATKHSLYRIGYLHYGGTASAKIEVPSLNSAQYEIELSGMIGVPCVYIPSHRPVFRYKPLEAITTKKMNADDAFRDFSNESQSHYTGYSRRDGSVSFSMKNALISWLIQGYGVSHNNKKIMPADESQQQYFEGFQTVLKKLLPESIGFESIEARNMEIVFVCHGENNDFILENSSGGVSSIINIAWQIYFYSLSHGEVFTVMIDEIENHLHPKLQREILPNLVKAFPTAKFIVTTHSPLVISSLQHAKVYVFRHNQLGRVEALSLDFNDEAKTATEILDEVLGVSVSIPIWAENELKKILGDHSKKIDETNFENIILELKAAGLGKFIPMVIARNLRD